MIGIPEIKLSRFKSPGPAPSCGFSFCYFTEGSSHNTFNRRYGADMLIPFSEYVRKNSHLGTSKFRWKPPKPYLDLGPGADTRQGGVGVQGEGGGRATGGRGVASRLDIRDLAVIADGLDMVRIMLGLRPQHCCHTLGQDLKMPLCKLSTVRQRPIGIGAGRKRKPPKVVT